MKHLLVRLAATLAFLIINLSVVYAQAPGVTPGALRTYSTIYSIGIEWDVAGDTNHNAAATVDYRIQGDLAWRSALPLVRVDTNGGNMLAGSILFLAANTVYEIRVSLSDPDGGAEVRLATIATRTLPALPTGGRVLHAVPGTGGGDGSAANPFKGIAAAQAAALAGDTIIVHAGTYGGRIRFDKPGTASSYLVWLAAGDGEVLMNGIDIAASHIWLEGLTVRDQAYATFSIAAPEDVVIRRCQFYNNHYSIYLQQGGDTWYIADNTIVGDTPYATESFDGEGIELNQSGGHTVANNSITNVADGISYPLRNVDIVGNDIFDTSDDGIEPDYAYANVRIWGNRIHNAVHNGISFQPQNGAPWYIVRNQIVSNKEAAFKFRTTDRFVLLHNTIVNWGDAWPGDAMMCCNEDHLLRAIARNNLWISVQGGQIWGFDAFAKDWRSDLDYDGFDWGAAVNPFTYGNVAYPDVLSLSVASALESRGIQVDKNACFETFNVPSPPMNPVPAQVMTLKEGCNAIDAGAILPNINEGRFAGSAPDLGAYEYGDRPPAFGPIATPAAVLVATPSTIDPGQLTTLSWSTSDAATITMDQSIGNVSPSGSLQVAPTSTTTYTLIADGQGGATVATATVTVNAPPPPADALAAPVDLIAALAGRTQANVTWTDRASAEDGFQIERATNGSAFALLATVGANVTTYSDAGLRPNKTYSYRVRAFSPGATSSYSNTATVTTRK